MNCERAQEYIALDAYDELTDEQVHDLGQHLATCPRCQQESQAFSACRCELAPVGGLPAP